MKIFTNGIETNTVKARELVYSMSQNLSIEKYQTEASDDLKDKFLLCAFFYLNINKLKKTKIKVYE